MTRLPPILLNVPAAASAVLFLGALGCQLYGQPAITLEGYIVSPSIAPPTPIYRSGYESCNSILVLSSVFPAVWILDRLVMMREARAKRHTGLCPTCGYDLRATPERCPECGAIPS